MSSIATDRADPEAAVGAALVQAASLTADTVLPPPEPAATFTPPPRPTAPRQSGFAATLSHIRYVLSENPVTGFAFALFLLIVLAALFGPALVPYDPLESDTVAALKPPSALHWFGTDQLGRDIFSRVVVATRLDFVIAVASVVLVFLMGGLAGVAAGFLRRLDRPHRRPPRRHHHGVSAVRARHGYRRRAWATRCRTSCWRRRS